MIDDGRRTNLPVNLATVAEVENLDGSLAVVNGVDYPVIPCADTVELRTPELLASVRPGMVSESKHFNTDTILDGRRKFSELPFSGRNNSNFIRHTRDRSFLISERNFRNGRDFSWFRASAIARSIRSSRSSSSLTNLARMASCSVEERAWSAVIKTSATASFGLIGKTPFSFSIACAHRVVKLTGWPAGRQANNRLESSANRQSSNQNVKGRVK